MNEQFLKERKLRIEYLSICSRILSAYVAYMSARRYLFVLMDESSPRMKEILKELHIDF